MEDLKITSHLMTNDALNPYRYSFAIENVLEKHHWTEKLADAFFGLNSFFMLVQMQQIIFRSFIQIDFNDAAGAVKIVNQAMKKQEFERRLPAILEARRRVLFEHNLFATTSREIDARFNPMTLNTTCHHIYAPVMQFVTKVQLMY